MKTVRGRNAVRQVIPWTLLALLVACDAAAVRAASLTVGAVAAAAGEKVPGNPEVPSGIDEGTRIPITVVHGSARL